MRIRSLVALAFIFVGCSKTTPAPSAEPAAAKVEPASEAPTPASEPDEPRLSLPKSRPPKTVTAPPEAVTANAIFRDSDAVYVRATVPRHNTTENIRFTVVADRYGLAASEPAEGALYVRFSGKVVPNTFDVRIEGRKHGVTGSGVFNVTVGKPSTVKTLRTEFFSALSTTLRAAASDISNADAFYAFATKRAAYIGNPTSNARHLARDFGDHDLDELMSLYTGASSFRDALQTDIALRILATGKQTIPIAQVEPATVEAHPWDKLSQALGAKATTEPLASIVPAGMLYLHAPSAGQLSTVVAALSERVYGIVQSSGIDSGTGDVVERYAVQMGLEHSPPMAALTDTSIDGIAIAASDPFFREGTDVSVIFHMTNSALLKTGLAKKENDVAERFQAKRSTYKIGTHDVAWTASADGTVNRHQLELGDVMIVSNSRAAIERFVAVHDAKAPSIASGGDFTYMRTLYPYDKAREDAFCFIGDAFVAHVISPAFKIAAARRVRAIAETQAVNYAAMLYAWLEGRAPDSANALVASKLIDKAELTHSGGGTINFDRDRGAYDPGDAAFARPLLEHVIDKVTPEERDAYASFRSSYERRWSTYIDPIAVRITANGPAMTIDARMLPITPRGDYTEIAQLAGPARVKAPNVRNGVVWSGAVGPDAPLRRDLEGTGQRFLGGDFQLGWLGGWVMAGASDRAGLFDLAIASKTIGGGVTPSRYDGPDDEDADSEKADEDDEDSHAFISHKWHTALSHAPLFVGAEVKNPVTLAALLTVVHKMSDEAAPGLIVWEAGAPFDGQPVTVIREGETGTTEKMRIALHYTTYKGVFVASLDRPTLDAQLTAIKEGRGPKAAGMETKGTPSMTPLNDAAQVTFDYVIADNSWIAKIIGLLTERMRALADVRTQAALEAVEPYLTGITDEGQRTSITKALLGYAPTTVDTAATTSFAKIRRVQARLSVDGNDDHRGLHTALTLQ